MNLRELDTRSREIFRQVVETYLETGSPVGSRTLSRDRDAKLSAASIRNVMADLEQAGLLYAPHTSAGRMPTEGGLRLFVDGLMEVGDVSGADRAQLESQCAASGRGLEEVLSEATSALSGLSRCAGIISVPQYSSPLRHVEFVGLSGRRGLVILVHEDGSVENRVVELPAGLPPSALIRASNFLNARIQGCTFEELRETVTQELLAHKAEIDALSAKVVEAGLANTLENSAGTATLIVRGRANLLDGAPALEQLERLRLLFDDLESKEDLLQLLELTLSGQGVRIFIGAENKLFSLSGSTVVVSPYVNGAGRIVGAVGVIGPTRINYARIIPLVDYTAKMIGRIL